MHGSFRQAKFATLAAVVLVVLFWIFFNASKHISALAQVNVFNEDPYDAVGSFGIQLAILAAVLSFVRILRPYPKGITPENLLLILRGDAVTLTAILVTMAANLVAVFRYLSEWIGSPVGWILASALSVLIVLTVLAGWMVIQVGGSLNLPSGQRAWSKSLAICLLSILILAVYPDTWRKSVAGAVITASVGMVLLFVLVSAIVRLIFPPTGEVSEDFLDDLLALYQWLKIRAKFANFIYNFSKRIVHHTWVRGVINWLNPRKHAWNAAILLGLMLGVGLLIVEAIAEGASDQSILMVVLSVYLSLECAGVLLGYVLFKQYLGIFRSS
jgi:hypothetical protein